MTDLVMGEAVPKFSAMLASPSRGMEQFAPGHKYGNLIFEEKFDGIRAMLVFQPDGTIEFRNRHGEDKSRGSKNPWLMDELRLWGEMLPELWRGTVLDGEIVADTWNQTMHELAHGGSSLRFVVFDLPFHAGRDLRLWRLDNRKSELLTLLEDVKHQQGQPSERIVFSEEYRWREDLASEIWSRGGEGVIVKKAEGAYHSGGRNQMWKVKETQTADAWIGGFTRGNGKYRDTIGAVKLYQMRDGKPAYVTQISGMTDKVRRGFSETGLMAWNGKVVEFEYHQRTKDSYRHPRWGRIRDDKRPEDCIWEATE